MDYYFDSAAAARPHPEVLKFFFEATEEDFANQEALHQLAYRAKKHLAEAAGTLTAALFDDAEKYKVVWASSATECFRITAQFFKGKKILSSALEHPALTANFRKFTDLALLKNTVQGKIICPSPAPAAAGAIFHHVQSETGLLQDLPEIFDQLPGVVRMSDAVQSAGKLPLPDNLDLCIISGIKFGAPGGAAIIFDPTCPALCSFADFASALRTQEYALSRINVPLCRTLAFAAVRCKNSRSCELAKIEMLNTILRKKMAEAGISELLPPGVKVSPYIASFFLPGIQAAVIVRALSEKGIHCASGSACAAETGTPSPALLALGKKPQDGFSGLRISLDDRIQENDIDFLVSELKTALKNY